MIEAEKQYLRYRELQMKYGQLWVDFKEKFPEAAKWLSKNKLMVKEDRDMYVGRA